MAIMNNKVKEFKNLRMNQKSQIQCITEINVPKYNGSSFLSVIFFLKESFYFFQENKKGTVCHYFFFFLGIYEQTNEGRKKK